MSKRKSFGVGNLARVKGRGEAQILDLATQSRKLDDISEKEKGKDFWGNERERAEER